MIINGQTDKFTTCGLKKFLERGYHEADIFSIKKKKLSKSEHSSKKYRWTNIKIYICTNELYNLLLWKVNKQRKIQTVQCIVAIGVTHVNVIRYGRGVLIRLLTIFSSNKIQTVFNERKIKLKSTALKKCRSVFLKNLTFFYSYCS